MYHLSAFSRQDIGTHQRQEATHVANGITLQQQVGDSSHHAGTETAPVGHQVIALRQPRVAAEMRSGTEMNFKSGAW